MATEANKKLGEQRSQEDAGGPDLAAYVHFSGFMSGAVLAMRNEAATGRRLADKVVGVLTTEEVKGHEAAAKKAADEAAGAGSDKNKGVYLF